MHPTPCLYQLRHWPHWQAALQTLKATQLKHIADATGLRSAGPKADLVSRIESELTVGDDHLFGMAMGSLGGVSGSGSGSGSSGKGKERDVHVQSTRKWTGDGNVNRQMRILSIDMGIRNLAFAHLVYMPLSAPSGPAPSGTKKAKTKSTKGPEFSKGTATLTAWHRVDLTAPSLQSSVSSSFPGGQLLSHEELIQPAMAEGSKQTPDFYLPLYAQHANTLLSTLLATYNPTHILIERQRFRSGGGSAVQEWSLRVGCFEAMLWAVLYSMARERLTVPSCSSDDVPKVRGVEPSRIVRYWGSRSGARNHPLKDGDDESGEATGDSEVDQESSKKRKGKTKAGKGDELDAKKIRIDLTGTWLDKAQSESRSNRDATDGLSTTFVLTEGQSELQETVQLFSNKWHGIRRKKGDKDIGKLDDLADCLVQGMTWLEWQVAKERIINEGPEFLLQEVEP